MNYAQDHAVELWANVPDMNRHIMLDGSRAVFGMCSQSGATVLVKWTGPKPADTVAAMAERRRRRELFTSEGVPAERSPYVGPYNR